MARWACFTVRPAMARQASPSGTPGGGVSVMRPDRVTMLRVGRCELAPPHDVGDVAERADHGDARALVRLGQVVGQHRHLDPEERGVHRGAEPGGVALVVGVRHQCDAGGDELGPGRLDLDVVEAQAVVGAGAARGPPSRPGPPRSGSRRPTASGASEV